MGDFLFQYQLHQFLGRRRHILKALPEGNDCEAHALQILHHLHGSPAVKGDLPDIEPLAQLLDEFLNVAVMHYIALSSHQYTLSFPLVIGNMISAHTQVKGFFRYPEVGQNIIFILLIQRRKHQHEGRNIRGRRQVQPAVANAFFQIVFGDRKRTGIPLVHWHPADRLLHPLVQP